MGLSEPGVTDLYMEPIGSWENGDVESSIDKLRYERVAYLLDRELGLNMVPVAVLRRVKRNDGALVEWIDDSSHEHEPKNPPTPQQMASLAHQKGSMRVFDALIYNVDRNISNWLVDDETWNLYLIDHSRSFRQTGELPKKFLEQRVRLSRTLYEKLKSLEEERLTALLGDLISVGQIRALLSRRDRILEKIDQDRQRYGEAVVFSG